MAESSSLFDLTGQSAVVTGASRGIGAAIARGLADAGANIIATGRDATELADLERHVKDAGGEFRGFSLDLSQPHSISVFIDDVRSAGAEIDILVNNAGTIERAPAVDHTDEQWNTVMGVDLSSQFSITRALGGDMVRRGRGRVIFTASLLSFQGGINVVSYTAAKSGLMGLTRALANEWAASGVTVNALVPGYIETANTQQLRDDEARRLSIEGRIPMGRWGRPDDLIGAAIFLAAPASAYVTGTQVVVDGGWLSR